MNIDSFLKDEFIPRSEFVSVPELRPYFLEEIEKAVAQAKKKTGKKPGPAEIKAIEKGVVGFEIKGLTGNQFGNAKKQARERQNYMAIAEGILSGVSGKISDAIKSLYSTDGGMSEQEALNVFLCLDGIVKPDLPPDRRLDVIRRLHEFFPVDFMHVANRITILTGMGHEPGKQKASGKKTGPKQL